MIHKRQRQEEATTSMIRYSLKDQYLIMLAARAARKKTVQDKEMSIIDHL